MSRVVNLPQVNGDREKFQLMVFEASKTGFRLVNVDKYTVCEVYSATPEGIAREVSWALLDAMQAGYAQAQRDMQIAMGIKL